MCMKEGWLVSRSCVMGADHGRVFRAQRHNKATLGAIQVPDTRETRTELPIDRRPAEEVKVSLELFLTDVGISQHMSLTEIITSYRPADRSNLR